MSRQRPASDSGRVIRAAIVITDLEVGGAETFLGELLRHKPTHIEVRVYSLIDGGPVAERIESLGIKVTGLHMRAGHLRVRSLMDLAGYLREYRPDVVHTWLYHADLLGGLAAKLAQVPHVIWHLHNSDLTPERVRRTTRVVVRVCALLSRWIPDVIVSCSEAGVVAHRERGYAGDRLQVIPNGVDTERFAPSAEARAAIRSEFGFSEDDPLIGLVARFDPQKNHRGFFEAARVFFERGGDADFLLAGRGVAAEHPDLHRWREATGHPERIVLAGSRGDVPRVMAALDVATSSSLGEAFPLVLVEAMASGIPCVATDVGDSALIVSDTGIVVTADDAAALGEGWVQMLAMPAAERAEHGRCARERVVANYAIEAIADRIWRLYRASASS